MTWNPLLSTDLTTEWQFTSVTDDNFFRFTFTNSFNVSHVAIAQAQTGSITELYDIKTLAVRPESEILLIEKPPFFTSRTIALRVVPFSSKKQPTLFLNLESLDMPLTVRATVDFSSFPQPLFTRGISSVLLPEKITVSPTPVEIAGVPVPLSAYTVWNDSQTSVTLLAQNPDQNNAWIPIVQLQEGAYYEFPQPPGVAIRFQFFDGNSSGEVHICRYTSAL